MNSLLFFHRVYVYIYNEFSNKYSTFSHVLFKKVSRKLTNFVNITMFYITVLISFILSHSDDRIYAGLLEILFVTSTNLLTFMLILYFHIFTFIIILRRRHSYYKVKTFAFFKILSFFHYYLSNYSLLNILCE